MRARERARAGERDKGEKANDQYTCTQRRAPTHLFSFQPLTPFVSHFCRENGECPDNFAIAPGIALRSRSNEISVGKEIVSGFKEK